MIFERTLIHSLYNPHSIYFRIGVDTAANTDQDPRPSVTRILGHLFSQLGRIRTNKCPGASPVRLMPPFRTNRGSS